jgi:hypothetical protein
MAIHRLVGSLLVLVLIPYEVRLLLTPRVELSAFSTNPWSTEGRIYSIASFDTQSNNFRWTLKTLASLARIWTAACVDLISLLALFEGFFRAAYTFDCIDGLGCT